MNTFRMISRIFAAVAVAVMIDASAKCPYADKMNANKGKAGAIAVATALPKNADAAKAALETAGAAYDQANLDAAALALNFAVNFTARKVGHCLAKHGYDLDPIGIVPGTVGDHVNPAVKEAIRAVAPQVIASAVVMMVAGK